ncbi:HAMP domain-containing methyl-accepting chemotaxis protein [Ramlibacter sp. MAHUQ-53]|uniref:HAMP domain-containing methyl-accepting chemotaxis protein n=1 Tax=unclassified Ramlibacter TaxID=2617605 RepID=UPI00363EA9AA
MIRLDSLRHLRVRTRLMALVAFLSLIAVVIGVNGARSMGAAVDGFRSVYELRIVPIRDLKVIADMYAVNIVDATHKVRNGNFSWDEGRKSVADAERQIGEKWAAFLSHDLVEAERQLVAEIEPMLKVAQGELDVLKVLLVKEDREGLARFSIERLYPAIDPISSKFSDLIERELKLADDEFHLAERAYRANILLIAALVAGGLIAGLLIAFWVLRSITRPLEGVRNVAMAVAATSDYSRRVAVASDDEVGQTARAFNQMLQTQQEAITAVNRTVQALAAGDLRQRVSGHLQGDLGAMKDAVNASADQIERTFAEVLKVTQALRAGRFDAAAGAQLQGAFGEVVRDALDAMAALQSMIGDIGRVMQKVARGDLSLQVQAQGQGELETLKRDINDSLQALGQALRAIHANTRQVAAASGQASQAIGQISDGAQSQTHAIGQVAVAVRQSAASVADVSRNTSLASEKSRESIATMRGGMARMEELVQAVNNLAANSEKINKITEVIEKIANKTNLLSLNAAIEAARAGEHGKGFSVVADEVGKLAQSSAESSQEIAKLVGEAVQEIGRAVVTVRNVSNDMASIERGSAETDTMLQRISAALEEQSTAVEEINANLGSLDRIARSNAAASEQITATVVELSRLADTTRQEVEKFRA